MMPSDIGATIRRLRIERGMSQGHVEKHSGLLRCYQSKVENGHSRPTLHTLIRFAAALGVEVAQFFSDEAPRRRSEPALSAEDLHFLVQVNRHTRHLSEFQRNLLIAEIQRFAHSRHSDLERAS